MWHGTERGGGVHDTTDDDTADDDAARDEAASTTGEHADGRIDEETFGGSPAPEMIERRAEGRPPEEADSDDPSAQAEVILTESDERIRERAADADPAEG
jgi:hypothetical protein